jgi:4-alpha-glucanotransferase
MRHAGVLRLDHAMGLKQLYWVPRGAGPEHGAYVTYPFDDLLGILALESQRSRCAVIGEDLGTVPAGFSRTLNDAAILSYRVLLFERDEEDGTFLPPRAYERMAAAAFSTHDIATLRGFWLGTDLAWRRRLGLYPSAESADEDIAHRRLDRRLLLDALRAEGLISADVAQIVLPHDDAPVFAQELAEAVHRFLGRSAAALTLVQIEDALGEGEQPNLPGTVHEHPNWRRKLSCALEDLPRHRGFAAILAALDRARKEAAR